MEYKYFIEDADTHEWYWFRLSGLHHTGRGCNCLKCLGIETSGFTNDPDKAWGFTKKEHAEDYLKDGIGTDGKYLNNMDFYKGHIGYERRKLIVTEHEFVLAVTPNEVQK